MVKGSFEIKGDLSVVTASNPTQIGAGNIDIEGSITLDGSIAENTVGHGIIIKDLKSLTFKEQSTLLENGYYVDSLDSLLKSKKSNVITTYSPSNTRGDLIIHNSTTQVRLPIGIDGDMLVSDSTNANGIVWKTNYSFIGGSISVITENSIYCSLLGMYSNYASIFGSYSCLKNGSEILFGVPGYMTLVYISEDCETDTYLVVSDEHIVLKPKNSSVISTSPVYFSSLELIHIYSKCPTSFKTSWNFKIDYVANDPVVLVLAENQIINLDDTPADLVLSGTLSNEVFWEVSEDDTLFTLPVVVPSASLSFSSAEIGDIIITTSYRAFLKILINGTIVHRYSNHIDIIVLIPDPLFMLACKNFSLFTSSGAVTNSGTTTFTGFVGSNAGTVSGFGSNNPNVRESDTLTQASSDNLLTVYNNIRGYGTTSQAHGAIFGNGEILFGGAYECVGAGSMAGTLTLDGGGDIQSLFIFIINGALAGGALTTMVLQNGAKPYNVYWSVPGALSFGASSDITGTFICFDGAIAVGNASQVNGRLLTIAGAVTSANNTFDYNHQL
jgi:hypothetical protein